MLNSVLGPARSKITDPSFELISILWTRIRHFQGCEHWYWNTYTHALNLCSKFYWMSSWKNNGNLSSNCDGMNPATDIRSQIPTEFPSACLQTCTFRYALPRYSVFLPTFRSLKQVLLAAANALISNCIWNLSSSQTVVKSCKLKILGSPGISLFKIMFNLLLISPQQFDPDLTVM